MSNDEKTLRDLGERRIVSDLIVPRFPPRQDQLVGIGDDCAILPPPPEHEALVFTTDPCPEPVICQLERADYYHHGRLTMLINVSDLAAMGARPLGLLVSTVMPETMPVAAYERFLEGLRDASEEWSCPVIGGNIKDGPHFTATGSAIGAVRRDRILRRSGARPGDRVCVIGDLGLFWAAVLDRLDRCADLTPDDRALLDGALYRPVARLREGGLLAEYGCTACMDSSDGVGGTIAELARASGVDVVIDSSTLIPLPAVAKVAGHTGIDPRKIMLAWGDWQLVCTVAPDHLAALTKHLVALGTPIYPIGDVRGGNGSVVVNDSFGRGQLTNFASERFADTSIFTHGLDGYLDLLRKAPLYHGDAA